MKQARANSRNKRARGGTITESRVLQIDPAKSKDRKFQPCWAEQKQVSYIS